MICAYIDAYKHRFGVEPICVVLTEHHMPIAPKSYDAHRREPVSAAPLAEQLPTTDHLRTALPSHQHPDRGSCVTQQPPANPGRFNKTECIRTQVFHQGPYRTIGDVEYATAGWVDWYNNRRVHSSIGMIPPAEHEQNYYAALTREPQPA